MTSKPWSRNARVMVLAPRSGPSSTGLATTTRYGRFIEPRTIRPVHWLAPIASDRHTVAVPRPQLRTPLARAVVPVAGGIAFFAVVALVLWGVASLVSNNGGATNNLASSVFQP